MDAFQILVIVLSVMLAIFLILGIVLLATFISISRKIKHITETISDATDEAKAFLENLRNLATPAVIARVFIKFIKRAINRRK
jgi:predicted PurR-regulated permease PerM